MEITIRDIVKAVIKRWYIMLATISVLTAVGTGLGIKDYKTPTYTASSSYLFNISTSNVALYIGNCKAYLETTNLEFEIQNEMRDKFGESVEYNVSIVTTSALMSVTVKSGREDVAIAVMQAYEDKITDEDNPIKKEDLTIDKLFPITAQTESPSLNSLIIKILLFMIIGAFFGGVIILIPMYNAKVKEEKLSLEVLEK